ncbi:MAG: hypothetical protein AAF211_31560 [Myxococcota bacterium]
MTWLLALLACEGPEEGRDDPVVRPSLVDGDSCTPFGAPCAGGPRPVNLPADPRPRDWLWVHADWASGPGSDMLVQITHHGYTSGVTFPDDGIEVVAGGRLRRTTDDDLSDGGALWGIMCEPPATVTTLRIAPDDDEGRILVDVDMVCEGLSDAGVRVAVTTTGFEPQVGWDTIYETF